MSGKVPSEFETREPCLQRRGWSCTSQVSKPTNQSETCRHTRCDNSDAEADGGGEDDGGATGKPDDGEFHLHLITASTFRTGQSSLAMNGTCSDTFAIFHC